MSAHCDDLVTCLHQLLRAHYQVIRLKDDNIETCVISFQKNCIPEHRHIRQ